MNDLSKTIVPKSDQLNSDDLIPGPRTITITRVVVALGTEQPVSIYFDGDDGKPYKPCKSMRRVLVMQWGTNGDDYVGRALTLFREAKVTWAGAEVGGIRISHMSNIPDGGAKMTLTETKKTRSIYRVAKLESRAAQPPKAEKPAGSLEAAMVWIAEHPGTDDELKAQLGAYTWSKEDRAAIKQALDARAAKPATREPGQEG